MAVNAVSLAGASKVFVSSIACDGELLSRAQAKQVFACLDVSGEVELDFGGVLQIGRAFADEVARVWPLAHPNVQLKVVNAIMPVAQMLVQATGRHDLPQPSLKIVFEQPPFEANKQ